MVSKYIKENKIFASLASIWLLINFVWWSMPEADVRQWKTFYGFESSKDFFFPENGHTIYGKRYFSLSQRWDLPEVLAYGFGVILLYIVLQILTKSIISKFKKSTH